jgi:hypothetical protein
MTEIAKESQFDQTDLKNFSISEALSAECQMWLQASALTREHDGLIESSPQQPRAYSPRN